MTFLQSRLGDPRLHFLGVLVGLALWLAGVFDLSDSPRCPSCLGHTESVRSCNCYHASPPIGSPRR